MLHEENGLRKRCWKIIVKLEIKPLILKIVNIKRDHYLKAIQNTKIIFLCDISTTKEYLRVLFIYNNSSYYNF